MKPSPESIEEMIDQHDHMMIKYNLPVHITRKSVDKDGCGEHLDICRRTKNIDFSVTCYNNKKLGENNSHSKEPA